MGVGTREQCSPFLNWSDLGKGGDGVGAPESSVGATKGVP